MPPAARQLKKQFTAGLMYWHQHHNHRTMPWKGIADPYRIWLSEIMLQQTRVEQGMDYYLRFTEKYPTIKELAAAPDEEVFKLWEGLGYYSRCKNLLATARLIAGEMDGIFPNSYHAILALKGVGPYTAAAISSFAYNLPHAVVDGNVYRVLSRYFGIETLSDSTAGKKLFHELANELIDAKQPALYNQAIMDFGATVCKPALPLCPQCPLATHCVALAQQLVEQLPRRGKALVKKERWFNYFMIQTPKGVLVRRRPAGDIWENLHDFYLVETKSATTWTVKDVSKALAAVLADTFNVDEISPVFSQQLSHQTIRASFVSISTNSIHIPDGFTLEKKEKLAHLAFPKVINAFFEQKTPQKSLF